jgi:hypothetical protein
MTTTVLDRPASETASRVATLGRRLALEATVPAVLFASAAIIVGLHWDIAWHRSIGRDTFWSPPHVLEQIAATVAGLFCGWRVLYTSFLGTDADRAGAVRFWRVFHGPLGGWVCIWGTIAMISSAPFDNWWHAAYGLDVEILSPPHAFLGVGMITVQLGAMLLMLAEQNRATVGSGRRGVLFSAAMGLILLMVATLVYEYTGFPNTQHAPLFYQLSAAAFPLFLVAVGRAGTSRWPATTAAATYMLVVMVLNWVLVMVPATPKLAPIYNPVTHLIPPGFPIWLIAPAVAIDLLVRRRVNDWLLAPALGLAFVAALFLIQWPFASFLLGLDGSNPFFGSQYWDYNVRIGPWTHQFWDLPGYNYVRGQGWVGSLDGGAAATGLAFAVLLGAVTSRIGLWWGRWMTRVTR